MEKSLNYKKMKGPQKKEEEAENLYNFADERKRHSPLLGCSFLSTTGGATGTGQLFSLIFWPLFLHLAL